MKKQILNISPLQTAKIMAILWFVLSLPILLFMGLSMFAIPGEKGGAAIFGGMMLFIPIFYAIFGFISTLIGAWVYNLLAKRFGGIEYTTQDIG